MTLFRSSPLLRLALTGDALASGATGLLMTLGASYLTGLLGLPADLLRYAGPLLLPYAAIIGYLGTRESLPSASVWAVIVANVGWVVGSVLLLTGGWTSPTGLGYAFVIVQAVAVAAFADLQFLGLRRSRTREIAVA